MSLWNVVEYKVSYTGNTQVKYLSKCTCIFCLCLSVTHGWSSHFLILLFFSESLIFIFTFLHILPSSSSPSSSSPLLPLVFLLESDWDCVVVFWQSDSRKDRRRRNSEQFRRPRCFSFSLPVWLREADRWLGRETCQTYRETEAERERLHCKAASELHTHLKHSVWWRDVCYWKSFDQKWKYAQRVFPPAQSKKNKHTLILGIDLSSDLAFNEMRRCMNSFL